MALYFVTMDLQPEAAPSMPVGGLARIVREAILPSVEALVPLKQARKLVTGGYLVGERQMVFVFEADSEEEVREVLDGLPLSGWPSQTSGRCKPSERCTSSTSPSP